MMSDEEIVTAVNVWLCGVGQVLCSVSKSDQTNSSSRVAGSYLGTGKLIRVKKKPTFFLSIYSNHADVRVVRRH